MFGSILQVGLALGLALGTGVFVLLQVWLSAEAFQAYGWRIAFLFSVVLVIFGVVVRFRVAETPAFEKLRDDDERSAVPVKEIFRPSDAALDRAGPAVTLGRGRRVQHLGRVHHLVRHRDAASGQGAAYWLW